MCIAKIIVPLTGTQRDREALATAFAAAKPFHADVVALFVRADPRLGIPYMGMAVSPNIIMDLVDAAEKTNLQAAKAARVMLAEAASAANVALTTAPQKGATASCSFLEMEGYFPNCVAEAARLSDLIVFGPMTTTDGPDLADAFSETLIKTERPVLLANHAPSVFPGKTFIAWDGSATAAHALVGAMPFLRRASEIVLLSCCSTQPRKADYKDVSDYLAAHGLSCREEAIDPAGRSIGGALLYGATKNGADLLIMGGYGHSKLGEVIFGGVTQHVRWHASIPVLMIH
jgi:nucleotide-binding universal stress UspA family protein